ncbi:ornithine cyclodeaminase family protein [Lentzea sp. NPDC003310]|uniref:ornithine cyclodeaminase family protein n=1 Tax=Lentzea sp. NPDC003310 TaxID=3154447 RepID=UPI0033B9CEC5
MLLILDGAAVRKALAMSDAIPAMADALRRYSEGVVTQPLRAILRPPSGSEIFASMPSHVAGHGFGLKAIMLKPDNAARGLPSHVGVVVVFDPETGYPMATVDGAALTGIRTAAVSAAATRALARPDAGDLALIGAGVQAYSHLEAMHLVRELRRVRVYSRTRDRAELLAKNAAARLGIDVEVTGSAAEAVRGADLVCTTTSSKEPVLDAADLAEGVHVNAIGASTKDARELPSAAVAKAAVFVDSRESALAESTDIGAPIAEGLLDPERITEVGDVLLGRRPGRTSPEQVTVFKSLGMAAQDVVAGFLVVRAATESGAGVRVNYQLETGEH